MSLPRPRITPLTAATLAALVTLNAWFLSILVQAGNPHDRAVPGTAAPVGPLELAASPLAPVAPPKAYRETLARPAFFKSREPFVPPPPPAPPPPTQGGRASAAR